MNRDFKFKAGLMISCFGAIFIGMAVTVSAVSIARAQFPGGPVAVGQEMAHKDDAGKVTIVQAPPVAQPSGGVIQLAAFGWLEPYVDSLVQALIVAGFGWLGRKGYLNWADANARAALEAFAKNSASSLIADGHVAMQGKTVTVNNAALANEANTAATRIPDALKRFGITPDVLAAKIVDAIPQTEAGATIIANAHAADATAPNGNGDNPPTAALPA